MGLGGVPPTEADVRGETPRILGDQPVHRIDGDVGDPFRLFSCDRLDGRAAGVGSDEGDARCSAVETEGEVVLARCLANGFDVHPAYVLAFAAGLGRHQPRAQHLTCDLPDVGLGGHNIHAPGKATVTGKSINDAQSEVEIEVRAEDQRGEVTATGRAVALLPSRAGGSVVVPPKIDLA